MMYAVNTLAAVAGSLTTGFFLIPLLGLQHTLQFAMALLVVGALLVVLGESFEWRVRLRAIVPAATAAVLLATSSPWDRELLASGAYVSSEMNVTMDSSWGGSKGFFGGGGLILLKVGGRGKIIASSFGAIEERTLAAGQHYTVDTGHIVGFEASIQFAVKKSGSWKSTILGGEGLVCDLTGPGRVLMQTRSSSGFVSWLSPMLPTKSS